MAEAFALDTKQTEKSATRLAYTNLRALILTGDLTPGQKLKIDSLKDKIGLGASPIREALSQLAAEQLVVREEQRGFRTAEANRGNFEEILDLRCTLEGKALRQSIENSTEAWTETLVLAHHRLSRASETDRDTFEQKHKAFHMALIENCASPLLLRFCGQLYDLNIRYRYIAGGMTGYKRRNVSKEHDNILDAVLKGNSAEAEKLLETHYKTTGAFLSARLGS